MEIILIFIAVVFLLAIVGGVIQLFFKGLFLLLPKSIQSHISQIGNIIEIAFQWIVFAWCIFIGGWLGKNWSYLGALGGALIGSIVGYGIFRTIGDKRKQQVSSKTSSASEA